MAEGSIWEAFDHASHYKLDNMVGILDCNRLGQRGETELGWNTAAYEARAKAFGWNAIVIDGHNYDEINAGLCAGRTTQWLSHTDCCQNDQGKRRFFLVKIKRAGMARHSIRSRKRRPFKELHPVRSKTFPVQKPAAGQPAPEAAKKACRIAALRWQ